MPRSQKPDPIVDAVEKVASAIAGFDYGVDAEDFVLYELHRLIEEDRASFDDSEFRVLIDAGIRAHVEENLQTRAKLAGILRGSIARLEAPPLALRIVHALEDLNADLTHVSVLVRSYANYLLSRLESLAEEAEDDDKITAAADLLFESTGDREAAETALATLGSRKTPISARVLAHAISEPLLDEDLEAKAFDALKAFWPLPRHYMFYNLQGHPHEDIPLRWFELFVAVDELTTVDVVLEELRAHAESPDYREDLSALLGVLHGCRDPELENKILGAINSPTTSRPAFDLLRAFLEEHKPLAPEASNPWAMYEQKLDLNARYVVAAGLFDRGDRVKATAALATVLGEDASYPFALMLKGLF